MYGDQRTTNEIGCRYLVFLILVVAAFRG